MARSGMILTPWHRRWVYGSFAAIYLSGVAWILGHRFLQTENPFGSQPSRVEAWSLPLHGLSAMVFLLVLGSLVPTHLSAGWQAGKNLRSGLFMIVLQGVLIGSAGALYYLGDDGLRNAVSGVHQALGAASVLFLFLHVRWGASAASTK